MRLRNLELKDAPLMLEWMHDESVVGKLKGNFIEKTLADAESFIVASANKDKNIHLAIVSDEDEYMGTVSLKNVKNGMVMKYTIESESEANLQGGNISQTTPIAQGLLGKRVGDVVDVKIPQGTIQLEILNISID